MYDRRSQLTGGSQKKSLLQIWITWFIMTINKENVYESGVFVLA